jgi:hypothetical protein
MAERSKDMGDTGRAPIDDSPFTDEELASGQAKANGRDQAPEMVAIVPAPEDAPPFIFQIPKLGGVPTTTWEYRNVDGRRVGYVCRWDHTDDEGKPTKTTMPVCFCQLSNGKRAWRAKGFPEPRPLYGAHLVADSDQGALPVYVFEGEKTCDRGRETFAQQAVCVTSAGGSKAAGKSDWGTVVGCDVVVLPDHDEAGRSYANDVAEQCLDAGAKTVRVVDWPDDVFDFPNGWDIADGGAVVLARDGSGRSFGTEDLKAAIDNAPDYEPKNPDGDREVEGTGLAPSEAITFMNNRHFVVMAGGQAVVATERADGGLDMSSPSSIRQYYANRRVVFQSENGPKSVQLGTWWLSEPRRRTYQYIVLDPERSADSNVFNLWRGFGIKPAPGDWAFFKGHIEEVICAGDAELTDYVTKWLAWTFQNPGKRAEAVLALRGPEGTGKGSFAQPILRIFGQHAMQITSSHHLVGKFNGHLENKLFLFADEALFAGDKASEGHLKGLITEPELIVERKGIDAVSHPNRLKILMATNNDWAVPAGRTARRYAVLDIAAIRQNEQSYFRRLNEQMRNGGDAAMLHDLLDLDLDGWSPRDIPHTEALVEQKIRSLEATPEFWVSALSEREIGNHDWDEACSIPKDEIWDGYLKFCSGSRYRQADTPAQFWKTTRQLMTVREHRPRDPFSGRTREVKLPPFEQARKTVADWLQEPNMQWPDNDEEGRSYEI